MFVLFGSWVILELGVVALHSLGLVPWLALHVAFLIVFSGLIVGIQAMALQAVDGAAPSVSSLPGMLKRGPAYLIALCLYCAAVTCGLLLLVVPGVYLAGRFAFFGCVISSQEASAVKALRAAGALARGRWWNVCGFVFLLLTLNLVGAALLGIGLLVSFPLSLLASASFFRSLESLATQPSRPVRLR